ncbi:MAG: OmpA family protein [Saprospiraceae bacterium]|nr:OmpA family protein [Saprospiraceae bacterium]
MFLKSINILLLLLSTFIVFAQSPEIEKANGFYERALYKEAIPLYEIALSKAEQPPEVIYRLAESYRLTNDPVKAEQWFAEVVKYPQYRKHTFEYAQMLKTNRKYDQAIEYFLEYATIDQEKGEHFAKSCRYAAGKIDKRNYNFSVEELAVVNSKSSDFAPAIYKEKLVFSSSRSVAIERDGETTWTNDAFNQHYILHKNYKDSLIVKPLRNFIGKDINDAPVNYAERSNTVAITSNNFMDGIRHIAGSGLMMDIYLYDIISVREWDHKSEKFFVFNASVDDKDPFSTGHPTFTKRGDAMYFTSNRPGGFGGYDIYVCYKTSRGWTKPKNLGYPVNTPGNEMSPFIDTRGRLYFSSDWHHGLGGMDIFTAERLSFGWGNIQNMGTGVNSPYDDLYYCFDADKKEGYFTSNRLTGTGNEDIYKVKQEQLFASRKPSKMNVGEKLVLGKIYYESGQAVIENPNTEDFYQLLLVLTDNPKLVVKINSFTDSRGTTDNNLRLSQRRAKSIMNFLVSKGINAKRVVYDGYGEAFPTNKCVDNVPCTQEEHAKNRRTEIFAIGTLGEDGNAIISYNAEPGKQGFIDAQTVALNDLANRNNKTNPRAKTTKYSSSKPTSRKPVRKSHYAIGDQIDIATINYAHGKSTIDEAKSPGLKELKEVLKNHPHIVLEIAAHTDATGSSSYNLNLSQKRADAIKKYLLGRGVSSSRLVAKGYGESKLLNRCKDGVKCSDAEHAANRRTEFKVIGQKGFKVGDIIKVENINYERNAAKIDTRRSSGLNEIVKILKENKISVEIRSHTDSKGSSSYNLELSQKRAKAIYDYLVKNGVNKYRLKYKGYGETKLLNRCKDGVRCSDTEHEVNRRTDFKVIGLK